MLSVVHRSAAFFDLDKTIIAKSSTLAFGRPFYGRPDQPARRAPQRLRAVRLRPRRRGRGPDERMRATTSRRCAPGGTCAGRDIVAETLHEIIDPIVYDEAVELIGSTRPPAATW